MSQVENKRVELWAHLVSKHATIIDVNFTLADLEDIHQHEHAGPGTIRDHDEKLRDYSLKRLGQVLSESEE